MSWCDKLASTPSVGFKLSTHFAPVTTLLDALSPILDRATEAEAKNTTVEQTTTIFSTAITTSDGFRYAADEAKISVAFNHRLKLKEVSGSFPTMEMLSKPAPFTGLIPIVSKKLVEATLLMPEAKARTVNRVGVIATTPIAEEDLPPGIKRLIEYMGRPWRGPLHSYNIVINAQLAKTSDTVERCIHTITKPEEKDQLLTLQFDWQRLYSKPWQITKDNLERILDDAKKEALKYFEDLAEGSRFDEVLIRESASV